MNTYAPIALFVYNRYSHVKKVVEAIKKTQLQKNQKYMFFLIIVMISKSKLR